jgi:hypothetical protein
MKLKIFNNTEDDHFFLKKYFMHPNTPLNNSSYKHIKIDYYDGKNGILFYILDNDEIISTFGAIVVELDSNIYAVKMPHRLHVRQDYSIYHNRFIDSYYEPVLYEWMEKLEIKNVFQTVNVGNERAGFLSWIRHARRRKYSLQNLNTIGQTFVKTDWKILPYLILEKGVWQYCAWASIEGIQWNHYWRQQSNIENGIETKLNSLFLSDNSGWYL